MWKKRALLTAAAAVVVCAVMFGLMVASAEVTKEIHVSADSAGSGRRLSETGDWQVVNSDGITGGILPADYWKKAGVKRRLADSGRQLSDEDKMVDASRTTMWSRSGSTETRRLGDAGQGKQGYVLSAMTFSGVRRLDDDGRELASDMTEYTVYESRGPVTGGRRLDDDGRELSSDMTETVCYREHSNGFVEHFIPRCPTPEESNTRRLAAAGNSDDGTTYHKKYQCTQAPCGHLQGGVQGFPSFCLPTSGRYAYAICLPAFRLEHAFRGPRTLVPTSHTLARTLRLSGACRVPLEEHVLEAPQTQDPLLHTRLRGRCFD